MNIQLVDDLGAIWKRWSIKIVAGQVAFIGVWVALSAVGWTPAVPDWAKWGAVLLFSLAALTAAQLKQKSLDQ